MYSNVFKCIWSCFYFENTKLNDTKVLTIKKWLKMWSILRWIHVVIYLSLLFHEYSRAAEPPVQYGVSHLSRRTEPHCL